MMSEAAVSGFVQILPVTNFDLLTDIADLTYWVSQNYSVMNRSGVHHKLNSCLAERALQLNYTPAPEDFNCLNL